MSLPCRDDSVGDVNRIRLEERVVLGVCRNLKSLLVRSGRGAFLKLDGESWVRGGCFGVGEAPALLAGLSCSYEETGQCLTKTFTVHHWAGSCASSE